MKYLLKSAVFLSLLMLFVMRNPVLAQQPSDFELYELWTGGTVPKSADLPELNGVAFRSIKKFEPEHDGYRFLHGVALARIGNRWVATFGHNKGPENTGSEEVQSLFSEDGKHWGKLTSIENPSGDWGASHGVLLNYRDTLWSFNAYYHGVMKDLRTTAYIWDGEGKRWMPQGVVAVGNFWPLQEPQLMDNGEWIMAGAAVGDQTIPAVAICKDNDFSRWQVKHVPMPEAITVWGESTVIVDGSTVVLISRSSNGTPRFDGHSHPLAWVSVSKDYGHNWTELQPSNMPMATSNPYAGILSTGQRYLVATTTADTKNARQPLTIAVSKPGENTFCKIYCIRRAIHEQGNVESDPQASLAYPYAVEHDSLLYVVYSNSGGRGGRERSQWNNNSAELAIIPVNELNAED